MTQDTTINELVDSLRGSAGQVGTVPEQALLPPPLERDPVGDVKKLAKVAEALNTMSKPGRIATINWLMDFYRDEGDW